MSTVDEWAKRRAAEVIPAGRDRAFVGDGVPHAERIRYADGLSDMAALLLSDEAVSEAVDLLRGYGFDIWGGTFRDALQAALTKITEDKE